MTPPVTFCKDYVNVNVDIGVRIEAALKTAAIGDALGVPYEFQKTHLIPALAEIEMNAPENFRRSHRFVPPGTWSDDTALMLALLDSMISVRPFSLDDFAQRMVNWHCEGAYTPDGRVFDVGFQTRDALGAIKSGVSALKAGPAGDHNNGCGSLMRVLPVSFFDLARDDMIRIAMLQSVPTHPHHRSQLCCAMYVVIVRELLEGRQPADALARAIALITDFVGRCDFPLKSKLDNELFTILRVRDKNQVKLGSGYVVDTLWSAWDAFVNTVDIESCLKRAISFGHDTDSVACVAGGFAGAFYGACGPQAIPARWTQALRGMDVIDGFLLALRSSEAAKVTNKATNNVTSENNYFQK